MVRPPVAKANRIYSVLGSNKFFYFVVGLFMLQAIWIALTALYPMAFDEQFHLGIIKLYSHQHGPFFAGQPVGADTYGAVDRDPSYMYHYLMSFPYRLIAALTHSNTSQIIVLRLMSVFFIATSLFIFRRLLQYLKASPVMVNSILLIFICLPAVPFLAAQINYDTLLIPLCALAVLWTLQLYNSIMAGGTDYLLFLRLGSLCMFTSLVKYAFLPIFVVAFFVTVIAMWRTRKKQQNLRVALMKLPRLSLIVLSVLLVITLGLFAERYGINTLHYGTPIPECDQVLSVAECQSYSPWVRNYEFILTQPHVSLIRVVPYIGTWVHQQLRELVFTLTSRFIPDSKGQVVYFAPPELPIPYIMAWITFLIGIISLKFGFRKLWRRPDIRLIMIICGVYVIVLWLQNFLDYKHLGQPVAIHGRYLLPIMPLLLLLWLESIKLVFGSVRHKFNLTHLKPHLIQSWALTAFVIIFMIQGGGVLAYIVLSRSDWFWPQSNISKSLNYHARRVLNPVVIGD
jgi:hypothetical protein